MAWDTTIDFTQCHLQNQNNVLKNLINGLNERCDAANIDRIGYWTYSNQVTFYDSSEFEGVTTVYLDMTSDPTANLSSPGTIMLKEGATNLDEFAYTDFTVVVVEGVHPIFGWPVFYYRTSFVFTGTLLGTYTAAADTYLYEFSSESLRLESFATIGRLIDERIDYLLESNYHWSGSFYANHTLTDATYPDLFLGLDPIPGWTEASILEHIYGVPTSRIRANPLNVTAEWVYQVYSIINNLLWVRMVNNIRAVGGDDTGLYATTAYTTPNPSGVRKDARTYGTGGEGAYDEMVSVWPSSWSAPYTVSLFNIYCFYHADGPVFAAKTRCTSWRYSMRSLKKHINDMYAAVTAPVLLNGVEVFDDYGLNMVEDTCGRIYSSGVPAVAAWENLDFQPIFESFGTPVEHAPLEPEGVEHYVASGWGQLVGAYLGLTTSITIQFESDPGRFYPTGTISLSSVEEDFEDVLYTAVSGTGVFRTFTVNHILVYAFEDGDSASVVSDEDMTPPNGIIRGWSVLSKPEPTPVYFLVLKFDVVGGFDYVAP